LQGKSSLTKRGGVGCLRSKGPRSKKVRLWVVESNPNAEKTITSPEKCRFFLKKKGDNPNFGANKKGKNTRPKRGKTPSHENSQVRHST